MLRWDLNQLRASVERLYGLSQREAISPSLDSVEQRRGFASYHYHEASRIMEEATSGHDTDLKMVQLIMGASEKARQEFGWSRFRAAAHITACVQSMHAITDTLAHALYYAYGMNLYLQNTLAARQINIHTVLRKLPEGAVKEEVKSLIEHDSFAYLSAMNNHSKHRSMVNTGYSLDLTGEASSSHGLKFSDFEYNGKQFSARWVRPTLESEYDRQMLLVVNIGQALNVALAERG